MRAVTLAAALGLASSLLLGAAWAGGAFASGSQSTTNTTWAGAAGEIPIGDALEVAGQPMQLSLFHTADSPARVVRFYADAFGARGLLPVVMGEDAHAHVSVFDPGSGLQRFISALPQADGQTLVLIGATNPRRPPRFLRAALETSLPVPPEHRAFVGFRSTDPGSQAESAQFVSILAPHEVLRFYRQALPTEGFVERSDAASESLVSFERPGATFSVAVQRLSGQRGAAVFVNRVAGAAP
jgi:hypothetical protein